MLRPDFAFAAHQGLDGLAQEFVHRVEVRAEIVAIPNALSQNVVRNPEQHAEERQYAVTENPLGCICTVTGVDDLDDLVDGVRQRHEAERSAEETQVGERNLTPALRRGHFPVHPADAEIRFIRASSRVFEQGHDGFLCMWDVKERTVAARSLSVHQRTKAACPETSCLHEIKRERSLRHITNLPTQ